MNNKGFSLIEVLAIVVIIGVMAFMLLPSINDIISSNVEKEKQGYFNLLRENLDIYMVDKKNSISWNNDKTNITLNDLKSINSELNLENYELSNTEVTRNLVDDNFNIYNYQYKIILNYSNTCYQSICNNNSTCSTIQEVSCS